MSENENIIPEQTEKREETGTETPVERTQPRKSKGVKWSTPLVVVLCVVLLLGVAGALYYFGFFLPYEGARNTMQADGTLILDLRDDGSVLMQWPESDRADYYVLTMWRVGTEEPFFTREIHDGSQCVLEELPGDGELVVRVRSCTNYKTLFDEKIREGDNDLVVRGSFAAPTLEGLEWDLDPDLDRVCLNFDLIPNQVIRVKVARSDGETWEMETKDHTKILSFGEGQDYPMPSFEEEYTISFSTYLQRDSLQFTGSTWEGFTVCREDMLGTVLQLVCTDEGHNRYTLTWNETKGEHYEIQRFVTDSGEWETVAQVPRDGERVYDTKHLERYSTYRFRVVSLGGQTLPDSEFAATPSETEMETGASLIYSTVWPTRDLDVYSDVQKAEVLGSLKRATACCVLDEEQGLFLIRFGNEYGYIDSNFCMINLPEYMGDLVSYNITNSIEAIYMVHDYEIEDVTGEIITGYERIELWDGSYLVPLLYPTAKKLEQAAFTALEQGYRLRIYDSYRPGAASHFLQAACSEMLDKLIPEKTWTGEPAKDMPDVPIKGTESDPALDENRENGEGSEEEEPVEYLTYEYLMTDDGRMGIGYFIAGFGSRHNYGVALDLTLEHASNRREIKMQSAMHDLSHYSELAKNNWEANVLSGIMLNSGFGGLTSEWWHFQDNEALNELGLTAMWEGVTPECWVADDNGWRYRRYNGTYFYDCTVTIDEVEYSFDTYGYVILPESENP